MTRGWDMQGFNLLNSGRGESPEQSPLLSALAFYFIVALFVFSFFFLFFFLLFSCFLFLFFLNSRHRGIVSPDRCLTHRRCGAPQGIVYQQRPGRIFFMLLFSSFLCRYVLLALSFFFFLRALLLVFTHRFEDNR